MNLDHCSWEGVYRVYISLADSNIGLPSLRTPVSSQENELALMIAVCWGLRREIKHLAKQMEKK